MTLKRPEKVKSHICLAISLAVALCALFVATPFSSKAAEMQEYQVKAVFINNMAKFTLWPPGTLENTEGSFTIYIMGEYRFGDAFNPLIGNEVHNRPLSVKKLGVWEDIPSDCRVLFLGVSDKMEMKRLLEKAKGRPILTISDEEGFTSAGGMIELFTSGKKIRFMVNPKASMDAHLTISSKLLKLAVPEGDGRR